MKNILSKLLLLGIVLVLTNCNAAPSNDQTQTEQPETETEQTPPAEVADETTYDESSYETTVLKDGIASPRKEMKGTIGATEITINYGSPSVKGRTIWGNLVPYDAVWRTGANEATTFQISEAVNIEGKTLPAGKYGLFTIPKREGWVIIFNKVADQWGAYDYDESKDVLRVEVSPSASDAPSETMDFIVEGDSVVLIWESLKVPFKVG